MFGFRLSLILLLGYTAGWAQSQLIVVEGDDEHVVMEFEENAPKILDNATGKLRTSESRNFAIKATDAFSPGAIVLQGMQVSTQRYFYVETSPRYVDHGDQPLKLDLEYSSTSPLIALFMTVEFDDQGVVIAQELPDLPANERTSLALKLPQADRPPNQLPPPFKGLIRFFSAGKELQKSNSAFEDIQLATDRTIENSIREKNFRTAKLKVFSRTKPIYPENLKNQSISGNAQIRCVVDTRGRVTETSILSASHPEFGAAAKVAAMLWRFIPRIKSGQPVVSQVTIPFNFTPGPTEKPTP